MNGIAFLFTLLIPLWISYPNTSTSLIGVILSKTTFPSDCFVTLVLLKLVHISKNPNPVSDVISPSTPKSSLIIFPSIWYPPQIPKIKVPLFSSSIILLNIPFFFIALKSSIVFLLPGIIKRLGFPISLALSTYLKDTWFNLPNELKSVKFDI